MPSNYDEFSVLIEANSGVINQAPSVAVKVYNADTSTEITTLNADINGHIASGTLNVEPGTRVRFRVENYQGLAGSMTQITT